MLPEDGQFKVTVKTLIFRKWWVDSVTDSLRYIFIDGVAADHLGTVHYIRAHWTTPWDNHDFNHLYKISVGTILKMTSEYCSIDTTEEFHFEERPEIEGEPKYCIGMDRPDFSVVAPTSLKICFLNILRDSLKRFVPNEEIYDQFQIEAAANASQDK